MKSAIVAIALLGLAGAAQAQQKDAPAPLTFEQALQVDQGLHALDGYKRIIKDGQREYEATELYKLGPGLRVQIGLAIARLDPVAREFQTQNNDLIRKYADGGTSVAAKNTQDYLAAFQALQKTSSGVVIPHIVVKELDLEHNPIQGTVLGLLNPILDQ